MVELLDNRIDQELLNRFISVFLFENKNYSQYVGEAIFNSPEMEKTIDIITFGAEMSRKKTKEVFHIILYVYIYVKMLSNKQLEEMGFVELVENEEFAKIMLTFQDHEELKWLVMQTYFRIVMNEELLANVMESMYFCEGLESFDGWDLGFGREPEYINSMFKMVVGNLFSYGLFVGADVEKLMLSFFYEDTNPFDVIEEAFPHKNIFYAHKPLFIEMLYIDALFALQIKDNLNEEEEALKIMLEELLQSDKSRCLLDDRDAMYVIIELFVYVNTAKIAEVTRHNDEALGMKKLAREKSNLIALLEYSS